MSFLRPSEAATAAMKTPKVVTTVAPVGRSQAAEATRPKMLTVKPNAQPITNRALTERATRTEIAAGTIKYEKTSRTRAICTELVTTRAKEAWKRKSNQRIKRL